MSGPVEIASVPVEDVAEFERSKNTTFLEDVDEHERFVPARQVDWIPERAWGARAGGRYVGTLRTLPRRLTVPGPNAGTVEVAADALTSVTVAGTHRRQGLLRRMLGASLAAARDRGDPVSILVAAEWGIYGRFGYWPASQWADVVIDRRRTGAALRQAVTGSVYEVGLPELRDIAPGIFAQAIRARAGHIDRPGPIWDRQVRPELQLRRDRRRIAIVHEGPDGIDGYLTWRATGDFDLDHGGTVTVDSLFGVDQSAYTALWGYVMGMDAVDEVTAIERPPDEPLPLLLQDGRAVRLKRLVDAIWLRLLDVPAALSARSYSTEGAVVIDVVDDDIGGYGAGRYRLEGGPDGALCRPTTTGSADLRMSQRALAAVYLGQPSLQAQRSAGYVEEITPGSLARADAMFATPLLPWVGTGF